MLVVGSASWTVQWVNDLCVKSPAHQCLFEPTQKEDIDGVTLFEDFRQDFCRIFHIRSSEQMFAMITLCYLHIQSKINQIKSQ